MTVALIRLVYAVYFTVAAYVVLNSLSELALSNRKDYGRFFKRAALAWAWPILAFSRKGRTILFNTIKRKF